MTASPCRRGLRATTSSVPWPASSPGLGHIAPWPPHGDAAHHRAQFPDPAFRAAFKRSLAMPDTGGRIFNGTWHLMDVTLSPTQPALEGRTIEEIAQERGVDPVDALLDIGLAGKLITTFLIPLLNVI